MIADDLFAGAGGCAVCGEAVPVASRGVTCSFSCRAKLREQRKTTEWRKRREYPADIIEKVRRLYVDQGMTVAEVQAEIGKGYKVQRVMERHQIPTRPAIKRDQWGEGNAAWRGDALSYGAAHTRVYARRSSASLHPCVDCGERAKDWSYVGGCPREQRDPENGCAFSPDPDRYAARCRKCHHAYDKARRGEVA